MKKVLLICTNELHDVVSVNSFDNKEEAKAEMERQYNAELDDECIDVDSVESKDIDDTSAHVVVTEGEYEYYWRITEVEI